MLWRRTHATQNSNSGDMSLNTYTMNSVMKATRRVQVSAEKLKRSISAPFRSSLMQPLFLLAFIANSTDLFRECRQCVTVEPMAARPGEINNWSRRSGSICSYTTVGFDQLFFWQEKFHKPWCRVQQRCSTGTFNFRRSSQVQVWSLIHNKIRHRIKSHQCGDGCLCNPRTTIVGNWIVEGTCGTKGI